MIAAWVEDQLQSCSCVVNMQKYGQDQRIQWQNDEVGALNGHLKGRFMTRWDSQDLDCVVFEFIASFSRGIASLFYYLRLFHP
ncbi:hypothetical protein [Rossellomorea sp. LjRoot5]|uniref:hypothetical protein n=1 Tax=Rossellomorea sp. LjRoot5 TaxID=3342331 RepID=UPI003ED12912